MSAGFFTAVLSKIWELHGETNKYHSHRDLSEITSLAICFKRDVLNFQGGHAMASNKNCITLNSDKGILDTSG